MYDTGVREQHLVVEGVGRGHKGANVIAEIQLSSDGALEVQHYINQPSSAIPLLKKKRDVSHARHIKFN